MRDALRRGAVPFLLTGGPESGRKSVTCGYRPMVGHRLPKPGMRVRSPLPAPIGTGKGLRVSPKPLGVYRPRPIVRVRRDISRNIPGASPSWRWA
jgi:hypothetical protein